MKKTVVPFRNGIMLSIAVGIVESLGGDTVFIANHFGDHAVYPDCRKSFIIPFKEAVKEGTYGNINIESPFVNIRKEHIVKIGDDLGVNFNNSYSCYNGDSIHCGRCSTCYERREAFYLSGVKDPTQYKYNVPFKELEQEYKNSNC